MLWSWAVWMLLVVISKVQLQLVWLNAFLKSPLEHFTRIRSYFYQFYNFKLFLLVISVWIQVLIVYACVTQWWFVCAIFFSCVFYNNLYATVIHSWASIWKGVYIHVYPGLNTKMAWRLRGKLSFDNNLPIWYQI